jgi:membrane associated rhomboid family serine protease
MSDFDLPQDPGPAKQVIRGRRINPLYPLMNLAFTGLIVWFCVSNEGSWIFALLLLVLAPVLLRQLALLVWPATITIEDGVCALRCGTVRMATPLANLAQFSVHGGTLYIALGDPRMVLPANQTGQLQQTFAQCGAHVCLPGGHFSMTQANRVCYAAGLPEQEYDALADRFEAFAQSLHAITPRIYCVPTLLVANAAVFLLMVVHSRELFLPDTLTLVDWGANYGPRTLGGEPWRLLTSMFVHGGLVHIIFNMWALFVIGALIERLTGNLGFAVVYFLAGLTGSLASVWWSPVRVSVGASGAIFGLVGALLALLLHSRDQMPHELWRHMRSNAIRFVVINILFGFAVPVIDQAAHLGGLIGGFVVGLAVGTPLGGGSRAVRCVRNLAIAGLGVALIWQAVRFLPPPPGDLLSLAAAERRLDKMYNAAVRDCTVDNVNKTLKDLESILSQYREIRTKLESLPNLPPEMARDLEETCSEIAGKELQVSRAIRHFRHNGTQIRKEAEL